MLLDPDHENGEMGYVELRTAIEHVDAGESYRSVACDLPTLTRQGLMNIHSDEERRQWYLGCHRRRQARQRRAQRRSTESGVIHAVTIIV